MSTHEEPRQAPAVRSIDDDELADRLRVAVTRLHRRMRQGSQAGLSPSQLSVLGSVARLQTPTLGELAAAEHVQPPTMSRLVAGMEEAGLLVRMPDAADRRISRLRLSSQGRRELMRIRSLKTAFLTRRLSALPPQERDVLEQAAEILQRLTEIP